MERYGDFFPENPQNLDELLEVMAQRMAAMQAMLNSMTPEQRAQLQGLSEQLLEDMDLRWQVDQLGEHLRQLFPQMGWDRRYNFGGQDPLGFAEAVEHDAAARRHRPAREPAAGRDQPRRAGRGRHRPGARRCSATTPPARSSAWPSWPGCSRRPGSSRTRKAATS